MKYLISSFICLFSIIICHSQNVGIGTTNPIKPLHVKGTGEVLKIQGNTPWIGLTNNKADSNTYDGFIYFPDTSIVVGTRYSTNMPIVLAPNNIGLLYATSSGNVGVGTRTPASTLDVNGSVNINGALKLSNSTGNAGDVLTSTGSGTPTWTAGAGSNNVRFNVDISQSTSSSTSAYLGGQFSFTTRYNLDPTSVTINSNSIVINKSGLYHFEGTIYSYLYYTNPATSANTPVVSSFLNFDVTGTGDYYYTDYYLPMREDKLTPQQFLYNVHFTREIYIAAPKTIGFYSDVEQVSGPTNSCVQQGGFSGYLISP